MMEMENKYAEDQNQQYIQQRSKSPVSLDIKQDLYEKDKNSSKGLYPMDEALIFMAREYMQEVMDIESGFEGLKTELALRRDFTLGGAFNLFSRSLQSKVTADELLFGLDRLDVSIAPADIDFFFRRYDSDQDGRLGFWEFSNALLPVDMRYRDDVEQRQ